MKLHEYLHKLVLLSSKHENKLGQKKQNKSKQIKFPGVGILKYLGVSQ